MHRFTRRTALLSAGSIGTLALAGCLDGPGDGDEPGDDESDDDTSGSDGEIEYDVFQLGTTGSQPDWSTDDQPGFVGLAETPADLDWMIDEPTDTDDLEEWIQTTDFDESVLVLVETVGPNTCYNEVAVEEVGLASGGDRIVGDARAVDTSDDELCGQAITYPAALVRVTGDGLPAEAVFTVTNGHGETSEVGTADAIPDPDDLDGYVRPSEDPQTVPDTLECDDDEFERHWSPDEAVAWGETHDEDGAAQLAMRVQNPQYDGDDETRALAFERGDEVQIAMQAVSNGTVMTGNRHKYALEVLTDDGWMDVRGMTGNTPVGYTDEGVVHSPDEGFEWSFELTEDGVLDGHVHEDRLAVCPDLQAGRYRFVFWGTAGNEPLAVAFDFTG
ncbi:hypothetical protein ACLI4Z_15395 [Natrialbaceae archaeon A-arb3/5]